MVLDGRPLTGRCCRPVSVHKTRSARIAHFRRNGRGFGRFAMAIIKVFSVMMPTAHSVRVGPIMMPSIWAVGAARSAAPASHHHAQPRRHSRFHAQRAACRRWRLPTGLSHRPISVSLWRCARSRTAISRFRVVARNLQCASAAWKQPILPGAWAKSSPTDRLGSAIQSHSSESKK